ncbi:MAG: hypothetical protein ABI120_19295 [Gemmatimonadaceae bacterium]
MRFQFFRSTTVGAVLIVVAACSKTADAPKVGTGSVLPDGLTPSLLVEALDSTTMVKMEQRTGDWSEADASSKWRAMASDGKIRLIDETMTAGESSSRRITHYFTDNGKLAAFIEFRIQTVLTGNKSPEKQFVLFKLEFNNDSTIHTEKSVNGTPQPVEPFEIENARKHSMTLLSAAQAAPVSSPAKP